MCFQIFTYVHKKYSLPAIFLYVYLAKSELRASLGETSFSCDSMPTMKVLLSNIGKKSEVTDPSNPLQTLVLQFEMYSTSAWHAANPSSWNRRETRGICRGSGTESSCQIEEKWGNLRREQEGTEKRERERAGEESTRGCGHCDCIVIWRSNPSLILTILGIQYSTELELLEMTF